MLGIAFALEGTSWAIAVREFAAAKGDRGWWQAIRRSKDPAGFIVLFEDSAALAGLVIAGDRRLGEPCTATTRGSTAPPRSRSA